jgi:hypothetical protein
MRTWLRPQILAIAGVLVVLISTGITAACDGVSSLSGSASSSSSASSAGSRAADGICEQLLVPAYFSSGYWETAIHSKHPPADMILNVSNGPGAAPNPGLQSLVRQAQAAGITVLGYSSTVDGQRPSAQIETEVREYAAWYGVTSIFLDRVSGKSAQLSYYKQLADYIHQAHQGAQVWLNPGVYPDQSYMSVGDVVMVFEGTYAQYLTGQVPSWALQYPAARFAHTIYATPAAVLAAALNTAQQRDAGHVYVTDLVGSNPYQATPSYWSAEDTEATAGCPPR